MQSISLMKNLSCGMSILSFSFNTEPMHSKRRKPYWTRSRSWQFPHSALCFKPLSTFRKCVLIDFKPSKIFEASTLTVKRLLTPFVPNGTLIFYERCLGRAILLRRKIKTEKIYARFEKPVVAQWYTSHCLIPKLLHFPNCKQESPGNKNALIIINLWRHYLSRIT